MIMCEKSGKFHEFGHQIGKTEYLKTYEYSASFPREITNTPVTAERQGWSDAAKVVQPRL